MLILLLAVALAPAQSTPAAPSAVERVAHWRADLEYFARGLGRQKDFNKLYPPALFESELKSLAAGIPNLPDAEVVLRLKRLVAGAGVAHNDVYLPTGMGFFDRLPLTFAWYSDGPAVTSAAAGYEAAIGAHLVRIGTLAPEQVLAAVSPYIPHENDTWLRVRAPEFLRLRAVLERLGLMGTDGQVSLTLEKPGGAPFRMSVAPADPRVPRISMSRALEIPPPLWCSRPGSVYWFQTISELKALYIQYNACRNDPKLPFAEFARQALTEADAHPPRRVVIDLRQNSGGDSRVIGPLLRGLSARRKRLGSLYALIGPLTFSSGVLNAVELRDQLHATLVGETAGGTLNSYGEIKRFTLANSRLSIQYTTKFFRHAKAGQAVGLDPDLRVPLTLADVLAGRDPVMAAVTGRD